MRPKTILHVFVDAHTLDQRFKREASYRTGVIGATVNYTRMEITDPDGIKHDYRLVVGPADLERLQGHRFDAVYYEDLKHTPAEVQQRLNTQVRTPLDSY